MKKDGALNDPPRVSSDPHRLPVNLDLLFRSYDCEGQQGSQLLVLGNGFVVVLLGIIGEVVDGDLVMVDVLHDPLLELDEFRGGEGVGAADDCARKEEREKPRE
jgi:hypothetical protein